jgi:hypothetical protein
MKHLTKKLVAAAALALFAATPAFAGTLFTIDFEKNWDYSSGGVDGYYGGGTAADGTSGPNVGVTFTNVSGLSNDKAFTYYTAGNTSKGVAYATDVGATLKVAGGFSGTLEFLYSSPVDVSGAVKAYDSNGVLLGSLDLLANDFGGFATETTNYGSWQTADLFFNGTAAYFDFSAMTAGVAIDNIRAIPEPGSLALFAGAFGLMGVAAKRKKQQSV